MLETGIEFSELFEDALDVPAVADDEVVLLETGIELLVLDDERICWVVVLDDERVCGMLLLDDETVCGVLVLVTLIELDAKLTFLLFFMTN